MAIQTSYTDIQPVAFVGMAGQSDPNHVETRINAEASANIPFGVFVAKGGSVGDQGAILPAASTAKLFGPVQHSHNYAPGFTDVGGAHGELFATGLAPQSLLNVVVRGRIWILSETAAAVNDPVFVRYAAGAGGTQLGAVRNATVANEMLDLTTKARYITSCGAGALALIEVDMTA